MSTQTERVAVDVIFRKYRGTGEVVAVFPAIAADPNGNVTTYTPGEGHGGASYPQLIAHTHPAGPWDYGDIKAELERAGYTLTLYRRQNRRHLRELREHTDRLRLASRGR